MKTAWWFFVGVLLLAGTPLLPLPGPSAQRPQPAAPSAVTAVVYVYEKDEAAIPVGVTAGINRLNRERKVSATLFEQHTVDGTGQTPDQYKAALHAAKRESIPALVVLSGSSVVRVVRSPKTERDVFEAAQ